MSNADKRNGGTEYPRILRWITVVLGVATAFSAIADAYCIVYLELAVKDIPRWLQALSISFTAFLFISSILYITEVSKELLQKSREGGHALDRIKEDTQTTFELVRQRTVVEAIDTRELEVFRSVFGGADRVRAYNPPLTLLIIDGNQAFRDVIYHFLLKEGAVYQAIVGKTGPEGETGADRILNLYDKWVHEKKHPQLNSALARMRVSSYLLPQGLHTKQDPWPVFHDRDHPPAYDLRGLSFFLIDSSRTRKVLLYILGQPFVPDFEVPELSLLITEPSSQSSIYNKLEKAFEYRWDALSLRGKHPGVLNNLSLSEFCAAYSEIKQSVHEKVE